MNCKHCGTNVPQTSKRERYYCDDNCRKAYSRSIADKHGLNNGEEENSITDNPLNKPKFNSGQNFNQNSNNGQNPCNGHNPSNKPNSNSGQNDKSITDKSNSGQNHISGVCYGCGEKQPSDLVDICHNCIAKGITRKSLNLKSFERAKSMKTNYERAGIHPDKIYNYIAYYLKLSEKKIGNATFVIKGRMFEIGKQFIKPEKKQPIPPEFKA